MGCMHERIRGPSRASRIRKIIKEVYDDIFHLVGETDSESSSSGFMDIMMEMNESFIDK